MRHITRFGLQSREEQSAPGQLSPGLEIVHQEQTYATSAGVRDDIIVYQDGKYLLVLSMNRRLDYLGMEVFDIKTGEICDSICLQGNDRIVEVFGENSPFDDMEYDDIIVSLHRHYF